jgi:hypothetical protein
MSGARQRMRWQCVRLDRMVGLHLRRPHYTYFCFAAFTAEITLSHAWMFSNLSVSKRSLFTSRQAAMAV